MRFGWLAIVLSVVLASSAVGQKKGTAATAKKAPAPMDKKAMEATQKAGTPGEAHRKLEAIVGTFNTKVKIWMDPAKPPVESTGTTQNSWVLGNRYVEMKYEGTFMGQPYSAIGYQGYDNVRKKYIGAWMENTQTRIMNSSGTMQGNVLKTSAMVAEYEQSNYIQ